MRKRQLAEQRLEEAAAEEKRLREKEARERETKEKRERELAEQGRVEEEARLAAEAQRQRLSADFGLRSLVAGKLVGAPRARLRNPPRHTKRSFARIGMPKQSLGTREETWWNPA